MMYALCKVFTLAAPVYVPINVKEAFAYDNVDSPFAGGFAVIGVCLWCRSHAAVSHPNRVVIYCAQQSRKCSCVM